jgi:DNA-binding Lrp family transcriptional regulator
LVLPISYVLINSNLGTDVEIIEKIKEMMAVQNDVKLEIQGVYGVYDILVKLSSDDSEKLKSIVTNDIRKIENVQSTLTMMVIEQQKKS